MLDSPPWRELLLKGPPSRCLKTKQIVNEVLASDRMDSKKSLIGKKSVYDRATSSVGRLRMAREGRGTTAKDGVAWMGIPKNRTALKKRGLGREETRREGEGKVWAAGLDGPKRNRRARQQIKRAMQLGAVEEEGRVKVKRDEAAGLGVARRGQREARHSASQQSSHRRDTNVFLPAQSEVKMTFRCRTFAG